jgi:translation initiation factor 4G
MSSEQPIEKKEFSASTPETTSASIADPSATSTESAKPVTVHQTANSPASLPNTPNLNTYNKQPAYNNYHHHYQNNYHPQNYNPNNNGYNPNYSTSNHGYNNINRMNNKNFNNRHNHRNQVPNQYMNPNIPPMMSYGHPAPYTTTPQPSLPPKPLTSPVKKPVRLTIKSKDGKLVDFHSHAKKTSISNISQITSPEPPTVSVESVISTPSTSATPQTSTPATPSTKTEKDESKPSVDSKEAFRLQFLANLKKKKNATTAVNTTEPSATPAKIEKSPEIQSVNEEKKETVEQITSAPVETEANKNIDQVNETKEPETPITEESEVAPIKDETQPDKGEEILLSEKPSEDKKAIETEEPKAVEPTPESNKKNMSQFFELISNASEIADTYDFSYPEPARGPDPSCQSDKVVRYDPGFLMQFEKLTYPVDDSWRAQFLSKIYLPEKGETRDKSFKNKDSRSRSNGPLRGISLRGDLDGRNNSRSGSKRKTRDGREKSRRDGSRKSGPRGEKSSEKIEEKPQIKLSPEEVKPLEKTANRWVPKSQKTVAKEVKYAPDGTTILYDDEDLSKKIRSLLNKLSLEKFDSISDELIQLADQSVWETNANALKLTVQLTFAKATDEPHWSTMYAKFCHKLVFGINPKIYSEDYPLANPTETNKYFSGVNLAYRLIVLRCQSEYEKGWSTDLPVNEDGTPIEPELMSDEYYEIAAQKRRGLGLVRFIGELYRLNLIKPHIITSCIKMLTTNKNPSDDNENYLPQEDTLETLHQFLLTVGQKLESDVPPCVDYAFKCINEYIQNEKIGSRIKYKFLDLIDLRRGKWSNADSKLAGPKTIEQIHSEFSQKQTVSAASSQSRERSNRSGHGSKFNSKWGSDQISSNDLTKVGMIRKSGENSISALRKGKSSFTNANDFQTVSSSRSRSSRGNPPSLSRSASTTNTANAEEAGEPRQQSNAFSVLMGSDNEEEADHDEEGEEEHEDEENEDEGETEEKEAEAEVEEEVAEEETEEVNGVEGEAA